ncbi:MAG: MFS transporter [Casimicrobium sp.]
MRTYFGLPHTVFILGAISFLNDAASDAVYPLLPLFFAATFASGPQLLGLIEGAANAVAALMQLISGRLYDKTGRAKPWMIAGYAMPALSRPLIAFTSLWPVVLALRVFDRIGKGLRSAPRDALLAASVSQEKRGFAFGVHRSADHAGAVVGPLVAAALIASGWSIREVLIATLVPGVLCVLLTLIVREEEGTLASRSRTTIDWRWSALPVSLKRYLIATALFALAHVSNMFMILRAKDAGVTDAQIPLLWAAFSAAAMVLSPKLSSLGDRLTHWRWVAIGRAGYVIVALLFALLPATPINIVSLFALYAVMIAATEGVEKAVVAELAPKEQLGTAFGWFHLLRGIVILPGSAAFGTLWAYGSPQLAFATSAFIATASIFYLARRDNANHAPL